MVTYCPQEYAIPYPQAVCSTPYCPHSICQYQPTQPPPLVCASQCPTASSAIAECPRTTSGVPHIPQEGLGPVAPQLQPTLQYWTDVKLVNQNNTDTVYCLTYQINGQWLSSPCYWVKANATATISLPGLVQYTTIDGHYQSLIRVVATDPRNGREQDLGFGTSFTSKVVGSRLPVEIRLQWKN